MKRLLPILTFASLLPISGCTPHVNLNAPSGSRPPNPHQEFYTAVASNFHDARMCEKISGRALDQRGPDMGLTAWPVSDQKSVCYFCLAIATKSLDFCKFVKEIITLPSNQIGISKSECVQIIRKNQQ